MSLWRKKLINTGVKLKLNNAFTATKYVISKFYHPSFQKFVFNPYLLQTCSYQEEVQACSNRGKCGCPLQRKWLLVGHQARYDAWGSCDLVGIGRSYWRLLHRFVHGVFVHWIDGTVPFWSNAASVIKIFICFLSLLVNFTNFIRN